ncbi:MAG: hypothetical protein SGILL_008207, partial [Bacillariaceae sp.]
VDRKNVDKEEKPDNPWGLEAEDDKQKVDRKDSNEAKPDNPWGLEAEDDTAKARDGIDAQGRRKKQEEAMAQQPQKIVSPDEVDMSDIVASLKQKMEETASAGNMGGGQESDAPSASQVGGFDPASAFERDGAAAMRFSPRDFRVKAATNDYDTLQQYISISTEHINRQDKNGWTALHFATRSGHARVVQLLLDNGADPELAGKTGETPLDIARERFLPKHPIVKMFTTVMNGAGDDDSEEVPSVDSNTASEEKASTKSEQVQDPALLEKMEQQRKAERRKKLMESVLEDPSDEDDDIERGRSRLGELLEQPERKPIYADDGEL